MTKRTVAIIACGQEKRSGTHRADELYVGGLFKMNLEAARVACDEVFVLSAKYGLLEDDVLVESYDHKLGSEGDVDDETLVAQIELVALCEADVYVFAPRAYFARLWNLVDRVDGFAPQYVNEADADRLLSRNRLEDREERSEDSRA